MSQYYIYKCIRKDTNEVFYVGSTSNKYRMHNWNRADQPYFLQVVLEAGEENCISEVIEVCNESERFDREAYWTLYYWQDYDLVNRTIANNQYTDDLRKLVFNEDVRQHMRDTWTEERRHQQALRAKQMSTGHTMWRDANLLAQMKVNVQKWWTEERRHERSEMYKGANNPNYGNGDKVRGELNGMYRVHLTGELNGMYGKKHSESTRQLITIRLKEYYNDPKNKESIMQTREKAKETISNKYKLPVSEIFLSVQGEGHTAGAITIFIRLFGCPLSCSYCDSAYATKGDDCTIMTVDEIVAKCNELSRTDAESTNFCRQVCLTGGEPLQYDTTKALIRKLSSNGYYIDVETSGAISTADFVKGLEESYVRFTVDYKCPSSGMESFMKDEVFKSLRRKDSLKFVVGDEADLVRMTEILDKYSPKCSIYVSPVFGKIELIDIAEFIMCHHLYNVNMQVQLHKLIWQPDMRGV